MAKRPTQLYKGYQNSSEKTQQALQKFKSNGFKDEDKISVDTIKSEINDIILDSREKFLLSQGSRMADPIADSGNILENFKQVLE